MARVYYLTYSNNLFKTLSNYFQWCPSNLACVLRARPSRLWFSSLHAFCILEQFSVQYQTCILHRIPRTQTKIKPCISSLLFQIIHICAFKSASVKGYVKRKRRFHGNNFSVHPSKKMPIGHIYTRPRTIFPTRRLAVAFRDRTGPCRLSILRHVWSHIQRRPRGACPAGVNWSSERRLGAEQLQ